MAVLTPLTSRALTREIAPVAVLEWPRMARLLAAAAVIGAIIGGMG
jgi:hypothetical protein